MKLQEALAKVLCGAHLERDEARAVFGLALSEDADPVQLAGLLTALAGRGETVDEITGAAQALRAAVRPFEHDCPEAIDTCGTGGDGAGSFNISTAAAIVACAAGAKVIKHGNRSVSSKCGSADLLEAAGLPLEMESDAARQVFEAQGIVFLFAPAYHPTMRFAAPVRKALGVRTIFNLLGPLCNPGLVRRQLLGVSDPARCEQFAGVLAELGHEAAFVVHGAGGADELTLSGDNSVTAVGSAREQRFDASALGLEPAPLSALAGGDAQQNLAILRRLLGGEDGPIADTVALNASAALVLAGVAEDGLDGVAIARAVLKDGAAGAKLDAWVAQARQLVGDVA